MAPLRICMVTGTYPPARCGVGDYAELLACALAARGAEVSVVTSSYFGIAERPGNPTVLPVVENWSLRNAGTVLRSILRNRPDIVHFQLPTTEYESHRLFDLLVPMVRLRFGPLPVVTFHEPVSIQPSRIPGLLRPIRSWLSTRWAKAVIVVAPAYLDQFSAAGPLLRNIPSKVIPIASNIPTSQMTLKELGELRRHLGISEEQIALSYFGFIQPRKGFEQVLDVLTILRSRGVHAQLVVVGELSSKNPYHQQLFSRIAANGLEDCVKITGHVDRTLVADYLAMCDACVLPFLEGVHPKRGSFLAAVKQGGLTVTTSTERHGLSADDNIYFTRPGDTEEMATAVQRYAGRRVARPFESAYSRGWEQVADEHLDLFLSLLGSKGMKFSLPVSEPRREGTEL